MFPLHLIVVPQLSSGWQHKYVIKARPGGCTNEQAMYSPLSMRYANTHGPNNAMQLDIYLLCNLSNTKCTDCKYEHQVQKNKIHSYQVKSMIILKSEEAKSRINKISKNLTIHEACKAILITHKCIFMPINIYYTMTVTY